MNVRGLVAMVAALGCAVPLVGCGDEVRGPDVPTLTLREGAERDADAAFRQAERLMEADAADDAEPHLRRALELDPGLVPARRLLAEVLVEQRRYAEAAPALRELLSDRPGDGALHAQLTECLHVMGDLPAAEAAYLAWIEVEPGADDAHFGLGQVLYDNGRFEDAVKSFRRAEKRRAGRADVRSELGLALQALGRLDEAETKQRDALERDPRSAEAWYRLGDVLSRRHSGGEPGGESDGDSGGEPGRAAEAVDAMRQAVRLDPQHVHAQLYLFRLLRQQAVAAGLDTPEGRDLVVESERRWRAVLRLHGRYQVGRRAGAPRVGDVSEARERRLRERVEMAPDDDAARRDLASLLHADGAVDQALAEYETLLEQGDVDVTLLAAAGAAALATERTARAIALLERARALPGATASTHRHLAWALLVDDRAADALVAYDALIASAPDDLLARRGRGLALMRIDRLDEGLQEIAAAGWLR